MYVQAGVRSPRKFQGTGDDGMSRRKLRFARLEGNAYERGCEGKQPYPTEAAARAGLLYLQHEGALRTNDGMGVYRCQFCREWHFGH